MSLNLTEKMELTYLRNSPIHEKIVAAILWAPPYWITLAKKKKKKKSFRVCEYWTKSYWLSRKIDRHRLRLKDPKTIISTLNRLSVD